MDVKDREPLKDDQYGKKLGELVNAGTEQLKAIAGTCEAEPGNT
jgi:hypothetical protein